MTLRVGLLGPGGIGARHAAAVALLHDRMQLVACCGRDADRTTAFAARFGASSYTDFARMLDRADLDLLIVALPPYAHNGEVEAAARAGIHLLVEKPIALDNDRATAMLEAGRDVTAACGFMYRFGAAVTRWDELAARGQTGRAGHFSGSFHCNALHATWWRERALSGGQMVEQLIHIADLARHMLGMPQTVYARAANLFHTDVPGYDSEDVSAIILGYDDGRVGVLHASNAAVPGRWAKQWQVVAAGMTGIFTDFNTAELVSTTAEPHVERVAGTVDPFVAQLADLAEAIAHKRPPRVLLSDGADTLRIVLAAHQSSEARREITL
ncbi:Gfo/Idh/MocA family protein [Devosia ginsengisoli]|uniref:Gfo/Idh/MocA family protein n=1 Tax=Devosia ginsengisoli TaxID=400770 RepID=UPI0026EED435|nr:Gfo/Idh/MocA family oxidoreductase [Devosia ginsengisoli]MCR6670543.1 Gfo/Idh/MocA family oxidoreductase [Devosia ginsengisoli]